MRRIFALLAIVALLAGAGGCGQGGEYPAAADDHGSSIVYTEPLEGEWTLSTEEATPILSDAQQELFDEATAVWSRVRFEPLALIAHQMGSDGASSAFLCRGARDADESDNGWAIVVVLKDSNGDLRVSSIRELSPAKLQLVEPTDSMVFGTWPAADPTGREQLPSPVDAAFELAVDSSAYRLSPIMLLGRQELDGEANYAVLCAGDGDGVRNAIFVATIHHGADGTVRLTSANVLAMTYYGSGTRLVVTDPE